MLACGWVVLNFSVSANQMLWRRLQPLAYSMQITEQGPKGIWRWQVYVESNQIRSVELLQAESNRGCGPNYDQPCESITKVDDLNIDKLFEIAKDCREFYAEDCRVDFDSRFRYPKEFGHLLTYVVIVEQFVPCEQLADCRPE